VTPALADPAVVEFLRRNHRVFLFGRDQRRRPVGWAMRSIDYRDGRLFFTTYVKSAKIGHFLADPEAACLVVGEQSGGDRAPWMSVRGRAEMRVPTTEEVDVMIRSSSPDTRVPDSVTAKVRDRLLSGKRIFLCIAVDEVVVAYRAGDVDAE
jgi:hypothetical protein